MTLPLPDIAGRYAGRTVAVVGNAANAAWQVRQIADNMAIIAVNRGVQHVAHHPALDCMVSLDANWGHAAKYVTCPRIVGFDGCDHISAFYYPAPHEVVQAGPGQVLHIRSNLITALRLAHRGGAAGVLLVGIDLPHYQAHYNAPGIVAGVAQACAQLRAAGLQVAWANNESPAPAEVAP